ncbi:MAG TPA: hypothetical protein IAC14_14160 [Candidatus Scybalomonas excrementigallinarum]|nr:hypothetical protein [Candidatus Scybalomonas excrementigallinarum]
MNDIARHITIIVITGILITLFICIILEGVEIRKRRQEFKKSKSYQEGIKIKKFLKNTKTFLHNYHKGKIKDYYQYYNMIDDFINYLQDVCDCNGKSIVEELSFIAKEIKYNQNNISESLFNRWLLEVVIEKYHLKEKKLDEELTKTLLDLKKSFEESKIEREKEIKKIKESVNISLKKDEEFDGIIEELKNIEKFKAEQKDDEDFWIEIFCFVFISIVGVFFIWVLH